MIDKRVKEELSGQLKELLTGTCLREGGGNVQYFRKFDKFYTLLIIKIMG